MERGIVSFLEVKWTGLFGFFEGVGIKIGERR